MVKKAIIEILLIPEALGKGSTEIEDEILKEFHEDLFMIPWASQIAKIRVVET